MIPASKPAPPKPAGPGPKPGGPSRPQPSGPPPGRCADDLLFAAVDAILDDLQTPARQHLSSAAAVAGGPDFRLPPTPPVPSFDGRTPAYELATGPLYDVLPERSA